MLKKNCIKNGFTLIELLVVVLIIGVLAGIALPQYQKAVAKAQAAEAISTVRVVADAAERYRLANGTYPTKFDLLDISLPYPGNTKGYWNITSCLLDTKSNDNWSLQLYDNGTLKMVIQTRLTGKYKGAYFAYDFVTRELFCQEHTTSGGWVRFSGSHGDYCKKIMQWKPTSLCEDCYTNQ